MECPSKEQILQGPPSCSVCFEAVNDANERSIAKLICGHQFHLDCIGSAFNAKGSMECPNCRRTEHGQWLYANGSHQRENSTIEDMLFEEEQDLFPGVPEFLFPHEYLVGHIQWPSYLGAYAQLSVSVGDADNHRPAYPELVVNVLVGENFESSELFHPCPSLPPQGPALVAHVAGPEENVRVHESGVRSQQGARHQRQYPPSREQWGFQPPAAVGVAGGVGPTEGSRWPHIQSHSIGHVSSPQARYRGRRRRPMNAAQSVDNQPGSQFWDYAGQSVLRSPNREPEPRNNAAFPQRRQEGPPPFQQYPTEREGQRWAPPPLSGLYGSHGILGSELPTQVQYRAPAPQNHSRIEPSFQAFQRYEDLDAEHSMYPSR
ncbi:hypothetical protein GOP47_0012636 [Adiantum capillus-veneris]|uniref:RING-type domain-containing protein n=1 Tax=Adiantum capillus-veneris TaxID=13818 RepID=A0A9D4URE6_ADICA|nr:hypothetical protein GOP47_0012636 [Adiantum capillus-veneris]